MGCRSETMKHQSSHDIIFWWILAFSTLLGLYIQWTLTCKQMDWCVLLIVEVYWMQVWNHETAVQPWYHFLVNIGFIQTSWPIHSVKADLQTNEMMCFNSLGLLDVGLKPWNTSPAMISFSWWILAFSTLLGHTSSECWPVNKWIDVF